MAGIDWFFKSAPAFFCSIYLGKALHNPDKPEPNSAEG
jgi:hypothetical protein